ncbi:hypothetical protein GX48_04005 [Paracoccidioides brasiliensis]|nr:hypothetical protein GX48_04005 [Paracoccidioides brasiliensis]
MARTAENPIASKPTELCIRNPQKPTSHLPAKYSSSYTNETKLCGSINSLPFPPFLFRLSPSEENVAVIGTRNLLSKTRPK